MKRQCAYTEDKPVRINKIYLRDVAHRVMRALYKGRGPVRLFFNSLEHKFAVKTESKARTEKDQSWEPITSYDRDHSKITTRDVYDDVLFEIEHDDYYLKTVKEIKYQSKVKR